MLACHDSTGELSQDINIMIVCQREHHNMSTDMLSQYQNMSTGNFSQYHNIILVCYCEHSRNIICQREHCSNILRTEIKRVIYSSKGD